MKRNNIVGKLVYLSNTGKEKIKRITTLSCKIGRDPSNDIRVKFGDASCVAEIISEDNKFFFVLLSSVSTFINSTKLTINSKTVLQHCDMIKIGSIKFRWEDDGGSDGKKKIMITTENENGNRKSEIEENKKPAKHDVIDVNPQKRGENSTTKPIEKDTIHTKNNITQKDIEKTETPKKNEKEKETKHETVMPTSLKKRKHYQMNEKSTVFKNKAKRMRGAGLGDFSSQIVPSYPLSDIILEFLMEKKSPQQISDITDFVRQYYPKIFRQLEADNPRSTIYLTLCNSPCFSQKKKKWFFAEIDCPVIAQQNLVEKQKTTQKPSDKSSQSYEISNPTENSTLSESLSKSVICSKSALETPSSRKSCTIISSSFGENSVETPQKFPVKTVVSKLTEKLVTEKSGNKGFNSAKKPKRSNTEDSLSEDLACLSEAEQALDKGTKEKEWNGGKGSREQSQDHGDEERAEIDITESLSGDGEKKELEIIVSNVLSQNEVTSHVANGNNTQHKQEEKTNNNHRQQKLDYDDEVKLIEFSSSVESPQNNSDKLQQQQINEDQSQFTSEPLVPFIKKKESNLQTFSDDYCTLTSPTSQKLKEISKIQHTSLSISLSSSFEVSQNITQYPRAKISKEFRAVKSEMFRLAGLYIKYNKQQTQLTEEQIKQLIEFLNDENGKYLHNIRQNFTDFELKYFATKIKKSILRRYAINFVRFPQQLIPLTCYLILLYRAGEDITINV